MTPNGVRVLVVDDEAAIRRYLRASLSAHGYTVFEVESGRAALEAITAERPDVVILDLGLPDVDGVEVTRLLREWTRIPIIILSVRGQEADKIAALDAGADDYVTKPFSPRELASRIRAVLRRAEMPTPVPRTTIRVDDRLEIDFRTREVIVDGERISLRPTEYRLLYHLVNNAGWVMTHEMLLSKVWGHEYRDETGYLRLYVTYLRKKIEEDPAHPRYILTERGVGYRFKELETR